MHFQFILLIVLFNYLRKKLQTKTLLPQWDTIFQFGHLASIVLLVIDVTVRPLKAVMPWIASAFVFSLIYILLTKKEFKPVKSVVYAVLPWVFISFVEDVTKLISKQFHNKWDDYFEIAIIFSFVWLFAMLIINKKQQKALEEEKVKAAEREKEFRASESMKIKLEVEVAERTAAITKQKEELEQTLNELKATQKQLIQSEKMASLGELTAGIAHEIQNPLNFVNNFSEVNKELLTEMKEELHKGNIVDALDIVNNIIGNEEKINHHGKRADAIVKGMLQHSRSSSGVKEPTDLNALADEYLRLAYHGLRAKDKSFNATMKTDFDETIGNINIIPQDMGRVILNLITNAFYVVAEKKKLSGTEYNPTVQISTKKIAQQIIITVADNGNGIPEKVVEKIFQPFFTTKPTGQGTGLGLSMSFDIVTKGHGGTLTVASKEGIGATFTITLPI